jgi:hypothetical protein
MEWELVEMRDGLRIHIGWFATREEAEARKAELVAEDPTAEAVLRIRSTPSDEPPEGYPAG